MSSVIRRPLAYLILLPFALSLAPYLGQLGMETIVLGPGDIAQAHQPDEFLALERLSPTINILQQMVHSICIKGDPLL